MIRFGVVSVGSDVIVISNVSLQKILRGMFASGWMKHGLPLSENSSARIEELICNIIIIFKTITIRSK